MDKKRILIADDHVAIRVGVRHILSSEFPQFEYEEARTAKEVIAWALAASWDLVILDINFPDCNGLEVLNRFKELDRKTPTLVFSIHAQEQMAVRCLKAGAMGYLNKDAEDSELLRAVNQILKGHRYIPHQIGDLLASELIHQGLTAHSGLSDREFQVMLQMGAGKSVSEIAAQLDVSISTINTYRSRIFKKMGFRNNASVINYTIKNKLLDL